MTFRGASNNNNNNEADEFGLIKYQPLYSQGESSTVPPRSEHIASSGDNQVDIDRVPWELRSAERPWDCQACHFLTARYFWDSFETAFRTTFCAVLPAAAMLAATFNDGPWFSPSFATTGAMIAASGRDTMGRYFRYVGHFAQAAVVWLPIVTGVAALELHQEPVAWAFVYFVIISLMGVLIEGYARRLAILLFTIGMMNHLRGDPSVTAPGRICFDWLVGTGFGLAACVLPFPRFSCTAANTAVAEVSRNVATSLQGLTKSFWAESSLRRGVQLVRVQYVIHRIEEGITLCKTLNEEATYEFLFEAHHCRVFRSMKTQLMIELYRNVSSIRRVVEIVWDRPFILEHSERASLFGKKLSARVTTVCTAMDLVAELLANSTTMEEALASPHFDYLAQERDHLEADFSNARKEYFYERQTDSVEEFVPLMTVYIFNVQSMAQTMLRFRESLRQESSRRAKHTDLESVAKFFVRVLVFLRAPADTFLRRGKAMIFRRSPEDVRDLLEAVKGALAMLGSVGFYVVMNASQALLSGPTIIAFVMSSNPAEAVISSMPRLTGTLIGVVVGFFISTTFDTSAEKIAGLCILTFISRLVSHVPSFGVALSYANFVAISHLSISRPMTTDDAVSRIQQNTFAVLIYIAITLFVMPCRPTRMLRERRSATVRNITLVYRKLIDVLAQSGEVYYKEFLDQCKAEANDTVRGPMGIPGAKQLTLEEQQEQKGAKSMDGRGCHEPICSAGSVVDGTVAFNNSMTSYLLFPQTDFDDIENDLRQIEKTLIQCRDLMPFAVASPRMAKWVYPQRADEDVQSGMRKLVALLRTMLLSVRHLRERPHLPSSEVIMLLKNLTPCANDSAFEAQRMGDLMSLLIGRRRMDLTPEIIRSSHSLATLCTELHRRKSYIFLNIIQTAVGRFRGESNPPSRSTSVLSRHETLLDANVDKQATLVVRQGKPLQQQHHREQRPLDIASSPLTPQADRAYHRQIEREVQAMHARTQDSMDDIQEEMMVLRRQNESVKKKVTLPDDFSIPVAARDAEAMHTMTFSIVQFAGEMRKLLLSVEDQMQHLHGRRLN